MKTVLGNLLSQGLSARLVRKGPLRPGVSLLVWATGPFIVCRLLSLSDYPVSLLWGFSLCLRALLLYAYGTLSLCLRALAFYAYGPLPFMPMGLFFCY